MLPLSIVRHVLNILTGMVEINHYHCLLDSELFYLKWFIYVQNPYFKVCSPLSHKVQIETESLHSICC